MAHGGQQLHSLEYCSSGCIHTAYCIRWKHIVFRRAPFELSKGLQRRTLLALPV